MIFIYNAACNALECLLLHSENVSNGLADKILRTLRANGVIIFGCVICSVCMYVCMSVASRCMYVCTVRICLFNSMYILCMYIYIYVCLDKDVRNNSSLFLTLFVRGPKAMRLGLTDRPAADFHTGDAIINN